MRLVGANGKAIAADYLWKRWLAGQDAGILSAAVAARVHSQQERSSAAPERASAQAGASELTPPVAAARTPSCKPSLREPGAALFDLPKPQRIALKLEIEHELFEDERRHLAELLTRSERCSKQLTASNQRSWRDVLARSRVIGCTTTGAAQFKAVLADVSMGVLLVEEAAEILEAHVLTSLQPGTKHLILIGDHKQLRPKLETYELTVASRHGHDFNRSLFERLHLEDNCTKVSLNVQHRMHPSMSRLIRPTYPDLVDHATVSEHPPVRGLSTNMVFIDHSASEQGGAHDPEGSQSKTNKHEVELVCGIVHYLLQQGYPASSLVVLTPYLGQLVLLQRALAKKLAMAVTLDSRDADEIARADPSGDGASDGEPTGQPAAAPSVSKLAKSGGIRCATVDNFQGEEADVVIHSLVRCNAEGRIGFIREPERVNVLLSRARHGQIIVGSASTLRAASERDGSHLWGNVLDMLAEENRVVSGVPISCQRHGVAPARLPSTAVELALCSPCGGCTAECGTLLECGHACPLRCHTTDAEHARIRCTQEVIGVCSAGHTTLRECAVRNATCDTCAELKRLEEKAIAERARRLKAEGERLAQLAIKRKKAELEAERAREDVAASAREMQSRLAASEAELEAKRKQLQRDLAASAAPGDAERAIAAQQRESEERMLRDIAEAERRKSELEKQAIEAERQHRATMRHLQLGLARIDKDERLALEMGLDSDWAAPDVDRLASLRTKLAAALEGEGPRERVCAVLAGRDEDPPDADSLAAVIHGGELAAEILQVAAGGLAEPPHLLAPACARAVELMGAGEFYKASKAIGDEVEHADGCATLLAAACQTRLGGAPSVGQTRPCTSGPLEPVSAIWHLARALELSAQPLPPPGAGPAALGHLLAVLAHPLAAANPQLAVLAIGACGPLAHRVLTREAHAPVPPAPELSPEARDALEQAELERSADLPSLREVLKLVGVMRIKKAFFRKRDRIALDKQRGQDLSKASHNVLFVGNPGTGKTTIARLYAKMLCEVGALRGAAAAETSGVELASGGVTELNKHLASIAAAGGGALFVDEAYQLNPRSDAQGRAVLDTILKVMEDRRGELVVIFAGYRERIAELLEHNEGLPSRFPETFVFSDLTDAELHRVLCAHVATDKFRLADDKHARIAARRLGLQRGTAGFGNARAVRNLWERTLERQAARLMTTCRRTGLHARSACDFEIERDDLLGPREVPTELEPLAKLNAMVGLAAVKQSVSSLLSMLETNFAREDAEQPVQQLSLNRVFLGNPGTGKTTVASLYGQILKHLELLSKGDLIVKTPSDFIAGHIGGSEKQTASILDSARGCVLVIDEAYGLHSSSGSGSANSFQSAVIDTIVAKVQGVPGDDRCVLLLGYREQMERMLKESNPGLSRRFQLSAAFDFEDFTDDELLRILRDKARADGWTIDSPRAIDAAMQELAKEQMRLHFGNGGAVVNLLGRAKERFEQRNAHRTPSERAADTMLTAVDFTSGASATESEQGLDSLFSDLVGCQRVLSVLAEIRRTIELAKQVGRDPLDDVEMNFVFSGAPGTGKTTVARRMGRMFQLLGLLPSAELKQTSASEFSTGFVGQAAKKTRDVFEGALGGVLFIDEAYRLNPTFSAGGGFMQEVVDECVNILTEPRFKGKLVLILAGYAAEMDELLSCNAGLRSRVPGRVHFDDFSASDVVTLLTKQLSERALVVDESVTSELSSLAAQLAAAPEFANGRDVDTLAKAIFRSVATDPDLQGSRASPRVQLRHVRAAVEQMLAAKCATRTPARTNKRERDSQPRHGPPLQTALQTAAPPSRSSALPAADEQRKTESEVSRDAMQPELCAAAGGEEKEVSALDVGECSDDELIARLQATVVDLGYDTSHEKRLELHAALMLVTSGASFPEDIVREVQAHTHSSAERIDRVLRPQLAKVLASWSAAIAHEENLRQQLALAAEAERQELLQREAQMQKRLAGLCPMGFCWHREGAGWRCNGGSHFVVDLPAI